MRCAVGPCKLPHPRHSVARCMVSGVFKVHQVSMTALISVFLGDSSDQHPASPFDANTSAAVVLKELQKTEVGTLKKETGVTVTEESGSLPAGAYRFYRAQSGEHDLQQQMSQTRQEVQQTRHTASFTVRSSQVWHAKCQRGDDSPEQQVAVKTGPLAFIKHEADMLLLLDDVPGVVRLLHSNTAAPHLHSGGLHELFFVPEYNREVTSEQFLVALMG
ncbi:hypothetical protein WJX72_001999 [[Myrmecia] bisecta]|uniref:Uncharacterized protein n=1 Tax=[Myrmecia] bisecta TaxID=41462 RepID=A0AAW1PA63_9CHLO